jgi:exosome complex RNA-binding protein Csl4
MSILIMLFCIFGALIGIVGGFIQLSDMGWDKWVTVCAIMLVVSIAGGIWLYKSEPYRGLKSTNITVEFAQVKDSTIKSITLDTTAFKYNAIIQEKYPLDFTQFKTGDIVRYEYVSTDLGSLYLLKIEKSKGEQ